MKPEDVIRLKELLPTTLGSAEIREQLAGDILRRSIFSARMASASYLAKIREVCERVVSGEINQAEATTRLLTCLKSMGYDTETGNPTDLADPASERRLNLIVDTQRLMAASVARLAGETEGTLEQFPGWELCRMGSRAAPRKDWLARWHAAGDAVGWQGARQNPIYGDEMAFGFLALKSSPIWAALGSGVGGYRDTLGNPYPPFAYGSYMDGVDVDRETAEKLGLGGLEGLEGLEGSFDHQTSQTTKLPKLSPDDAELLEAAKRVGWPGLFNDL